MRGGSDGIAKIPFGISIYRFLYRHRNRLLPNLSTRTYSCAIRLGSGSSNKLLHLYERQCRKNIYKDFDTIIFSRRRKRVRKKIELIHCDYLPKNYYFRYTKIHRRTMTEARKRKSRIIACSSHCQLAAPPS